jgi:glycerol kinase
VAYQLGKEHPPVYALEGSIPVAGSGVNWLRDNMGFFENAQDIGMLSFQVMSVIFRGPGKIS